MAKFVKLEDGTYLNVDHIIIIDDHVAYTTASAAPSNKWSATAHLTDNDLKQILAATGSDNDKYNSIQDLESVPDTILSEHVVETAIEALREQAAQYQDIESKLKDKKDAGYSVEQDIADVKAKLKEIYRSQLELGIIR